MFLVINISLSAFNFGRISGQPDTGFQKRPDIRYIPRYENTGIKDTRIPGNRDTGLQPDKRMQGNRDTGLHLDKRIQGYRVTT